MRECQHYRQVVRHTTSSFSPSKSRPPFSPLDSFPRYAPDRPFRLLSLSLDLEVDPKAKTLRGSVTHAVERVFTSDGTWIVLDQEGIDVQSVAVQGAGAEFTVQDKELWIEIPDRFKNGKPGDKLSFSVHYSIKNPRRGLYFTGPDSAQPDKPIQVWSQGQDQDNHHWFPTFDYPNQKATVELKVTVPKGFTAISNGRLTHQQTMAQKSEFHYSMTSPIVTYLITLVIGEFERWEERGARDLLIEYFVARGRKAEGVRSFKNTPLMIQAFEKTTGVSYPYEKYAQVAVQDFIFGGMENASATTQTDLTLHDERAALDFSSDPLVAHELAHQWFGDLVTCRDWSHGWLNEGFATFFERVWYEHKKTDAQGKTFHSADEAAYVSYQDLQDYLSEDRSKYRRPIVCSTYEAPQDLFDCHLYQKGGLVLNLLRWVIGEEGFWKSIRHYVETHREKNVETIDLIRAIEVTTGRNLRKIFDQWVFGAGHAEWEASAEVKQLKWLEITLEQKQTKGKAVFVDESGARTWVFQLPLDVEVTSSKGKVTVHRVEVTDLKHVFRLPVDGPVSGVRLDPAVAIPKVLKFKRPREWLLFQLKRAPDAMGRIEAAQDLVRLASSGDDGVSSGIVAALVEQFKKDIFWGAQWEMAEALGSIGSPEAKAGLLSLLGASDARARVAVVRALTRFRDAAVFEAVLKKAEKDDSYAVEAEATRGLAATVPMHADGTADPEHVRAWEQLIQKNLKKSSFREQIKRAAMSAWIAPPWGVARDRPGVLRPLQEYLQPQHPVDARMGAWVSLGRLAKYAGPALRDDISKIFSAAKTDPNFFIRRAWVAALAETEWAGGLALLSEYAEGETDARVLRDIRFASTRLQASLEKPEAIEIVRGKLEKLDKEVQRMKFEPPKSPPSIGAGKKASIKKSAGKKTRSRKTRR